MSDRVSARRTLALATRLVVAGWGTAAVATAAVWTPPPLGWWIAGIGIVCIGLAAWRREFAVTEPVVVAGVLVAAVSAATADRLPVAGAALVGVLLVGYALLSDLAGSVRALNGIDDVRAWTTTTIPVLLTALVGAVAAAVVVTAVAILPLSVLGTLAVVAPVLLLLAGVLVFSRRVLSG